MYVLGVIFLEPTFIIRVNWFNAELGTSRLWIKLTFLLEFQTNTSSEAELCNFLNAFILSECLSPTKKYWRNSVVCWEVFDNQLSGKRMGYDLICTICQFSRRKSCHHDPSQATSMNSGCGVGKGCTTLALWAGASLL